MRQQAKPLSLVAAPRAAAAAAAAVAAAAKHIAYNGSQAVQRCSEEHAAEAFMNLQLLGEDPLQL